MFKLTDSMNASKIIILLCMLQGLSVTAQKLSDYTWKNRVLILSDKPDSKEARATLSILRNNRIGLKERDIIVLLYNENKLYTLENRTIILDGRTPIPNNFEGYMLLGKDGGIKESYSYPLKIDSLFTLIDGMPMRRAEMKSTN